MGFWRKQQISFFLTTKYNLACYYCYIPKMKINPEDQLIDIDFSHADLRDFFATNPSRTIRFFRAGKLTMAFTQMVEIAKLARQMVGPALYIELETNCYLSREVAN